MNIARSQIGEQEAKAFILSAVALSAGVFNITFWFGVFETVFFEHLFYIWVASTVALVASMFVPPVDALPALVSWRGRFVLILPTLWLLIEATTDTSATTAFWDDRALLVLSAVIVLFTLPYLIYVLVLLAVPDIDQLRTPVLRYVLIGLVTAMAFAGVAIGKNHPVFLTCNDFKVAGDDIPDNCRKSMNRNLQK